MGVGHRAHDLHFMALSNLAEQLQRRFMRAALQLHGPQSPDTQFIEGERSPSAT